MSNTETTGPIVNLNNLMQTHLDNGNTLHLVFNPTLDYYRLVFAVDSANATSAEVDQIPLEA